MFSRKHQGRRSPNILFVTFRLILSLVMFAVLLTGVYSAYKYFSGYDPLQLDPISVIKNLVSARTPKDIIAALPPLKGAGKILSKSAEKSDGGLSFTEPTKNDSKSALFQFLLLADSHSDSQMLSKALSQAKNSYPELKFIIGLGDYSEVGTVAELKKAKEILDSSGLRYFAAVGDHDLWDCRNRKQIPVACFNGVFGLSYQSFGFENFQFLILDNSDNYKGFDDEQKAWIKDKLENIKSGSQGSVKGVFVFLHEPLYHPSSDRFMGKTESVLKEQARELMFGLKEAGVKKVFAADTHFFSQYDEPVTGLAMMTAGALTLERNPQTPRFAIVSVFDDGSTKIEDIEVK